MLFRYYHNNRELFETFETKYYSALFNEVDDFEGNGFNINFLNEKVIYLPTRFFGALVKELTNSLADNRELIDSLREFSKNCPLFKIEGIESVLERYPVRICTVELANLLSFECYR
jgi:hypothetical protein